MSSTQRSLRSPQKLLLTAGVSDFTGGSKMSYLFAKALVNAGYELHAIVGPRPPQSMPSMIEPLQLAGITVEQRAGFDRVFDVGLIAGLTRFIRQRGITGVVTSQVMDTKLAAWAAWAAGVPCVVHAQSMLCFKGRALARHGKWWGYRATLAATRPTLVCVSEAVRQLYRHELGVPDKRLHVVENGIDVSRFAGVLPETRLRIRAELGIGADELLLVNVGRLEELKGQDRLLEALAMARLPRPARVLLVGGESADNLSASRQYIRTLHDLVRKHSLQSQVVFTGWRDDIPELLGAADGYVVSSRWEGFPLVLLEAMAASLPIVTMDSVPTPRGFEHQTHGYLVRGAEPAALAEGLEWLVGLSAERRHQVGCGGFELVRRDYDLGVSAKRFIEMIDRVMQAGTRPAGQLPGIAGEAPAASDANEDLSTAAVA